MLSLHPTGRRQPGLARGNPTASPGLHCSPRPHKLLLLLFHTQQIATQDAASQGWPVEALQPVLDCIVKRYREDALRMLALPMDSAVARGRTAVAAVIWEALVQGRPEPER